MNCYINRMPFIGLGISLFIEQENIDHGKNFNICLLLPFFEIVIEIDL